MSEALAVNFIDLFAGAGGLSQGFRQASSHEFQYRSIFAVEKDLPSAASYKSNFGHEVFSRPIEQLREGDLPDAKVDLVIGGPPCQGFSPLGKMSPTDNHRTLNRLWQFYFKVVEWVQPKIFVIENVPEFLKSYEVLAAMRIAKKLGYKTASGVLKAEDFGVPQQRRRGIVIGLHGSEPSMPLPQFAAVKTVRDFLWTLRNKPLRYELQSKDSVQGFPKHSASQLHIGRNPAPKSLQRYRCVPPGGNRFDLMRKRPDLTPDCWKRKRTGSTDVFGRLSWDKPSLTIRTEFFKPEKGCYLHPEFHRPITHWEAARLQTFPDNYFFCGSKIDIARQIGNAVPPLLAQAIAEHLKQYFASEAIVDSIGSGDPLPEAVWA